MTTPPPLHHVTTRVCRCCRAARFYCPRCGATAELLIFGDEPDPNVGALERCIRLPPARRPRRGFA